MELIFELSTKNRKGLKLPKLDISPAALPDKSLLRKEEAKLPQVGELELVRHYTNLSKLNYSLDSNFYPLGSCTMKYNPKVLESIAELDGFSNLCPNLFLSQAGLKYLQEVFSLLFKLQELLAQLTGMDKVSLQPLAGAQGELAGMLIAKAYHQRKNNKKKKYVIVPDSSHGTNPASVAMVGYQLIAIPTGSDGQMDFDLFKEKMTEEVAAVVMTCPNTLGIFNTEVKKICKLAHSKDAITYYDGANLNAILGKVKPAQLGFDIVHLNLHKTFATPHGGGGPGAGPVGVVEKLSQFLPQGSIDKDKNGEFMPRTEAENSIGRLAPFFGNFSVLLKALAYILILGKEGLEKVSSFSVLNANYIHQALKNFYPVPFKRRSMHEVVLSAAKQKKKGVTALDIAKFLIQEGVHPPTIYFPLIVEEALMIEPTETENKKTLDNFIKIMIKAAKLAKENPQLLKQAPSNFIFSRFDEVKAARSRNLNYNSL
ncbi:MAG: aminomethyl-transferring glycine dehydrogenase subunit GcvPB [Candidatus Omnitrophica bacterium]|nr:aminomethyl-transferring glycine dehydrogenase subunit GcvPB [Candidatus Omnitrophota bacterium]MCF7878327.1 aminomethyl-transferring glycine dehydrogenase subunit GcvPB [Candidatus Omnitrophota bacterium]